jgi:hypothetical protein
MPRPSRRKGSPLITVGMLAIGVALLVLVWLMI